MTERRGGLGRGLGALIPSAIPEHERDSAEVSSRQPAEGGYPRYGAGAALSVAPPLPVVEERGYGAAAARPAASVAPPSAAAQPVTEDTAYGAGAAQSEAELSVASPRPGAGDTGTAPVAARFAELDVGLIRPNPRQPRQVFDDEALAELVGSIREIGVLQPVVVRELGPHEDARFELVMGERRWRAAREAGLTTVPAIIRETPDTALLRDALLENLHRAQLNPLEEAAAYDQLLQDFGCTQEELSERIGRSRPQISNTLRLLRLPPSVQRRLAAGVLSAGHARALLGLPQSADQERLAQRIVAEGLSVRSVEELVAVGIPGDGARARASRSRPPDQPALADVAARLSDRLDTRVRVEHGRSKGKIIIEFASLEDMARIVSALDPTVEVAHKST